MNPHNKNESETRADHIDPALKAAGWGEVPGSVIRREYHITKGRIQPNGKNAKADIADYILVYHGKKLAVIEAKAWSKPVSEGVGQAKAYAEKLGVRFTYSTNGQGIYGIDMDTGEEGDKPTWPTPQELWDLKFPIQNDWRDRFAQIPYEDKGGAFAGRYYQDTAVENVLSAIAENKNRILLTLATGTGKTFIAFQIAWKLFHSKWNISKQPTRRPRILFLADRNILADQAYNSFSAFPADSMVRISASELGKKGEVPTNASLFFTIFQTFMSGPENTEYYGQYPKDFFDLIIIDECHRGGANDESTWRKIMEHFSSAVQIGLTATPKRKDNADTYAYFGEPVFVYSLKEGIEDGFLTPFKVRTVSSTLDTYKFSPGDVVKEGEIDTEKTYGEKDFHRLLVIPAREKERVKAFMSEVDQDEKTLIFCASQDHALMVRDLVNQMKLSKDVNYCHRVTADDGERGEQHLRDFQDNDKIIPTVLTTSQKLSTGVDARNVRHIVLLRPVNSMIEFKQIIGRGTRLYDGKAYFTIWDYVKAHELFKDPEWDGDPDAPSGGDRIVDPKPSKVCPTCNQSPCTCPEKICPKCGETESYCICDKFVKAKIELGDGKKRDIVVTKESQFWHDGQMVTVQQFMEALFGKIPDFFASEEELREIWSRPDTRSQLMKGLAESGYGDEAFEEMVKILGAKDWDLFDVLAHIAYASSPLTRAARAKHAKEHVRLNYDDKQMAFLEFVLGQYVRVGVSELEQEKLFPLLKLKYEGAIDDAIDALGPAEQLAPWFGSFQKHLYSLPEN
jgi:type I restriction enzyme, R subunit